MTNQSGTTDGTATCDVYGNLTASTGTIPTYGFTGREPDETGLVFFRARYYDPTIGRFFQSDPIGLAGGMNFYVYLGNNPVALVDPSGLRPLTPGEINMLSPVFNNRIDYGKIDVREGASLDPRSWPPIVTGSAVTLENVIHIPSASYRNDFAAYGSNCTAREVGLQSLVVHETGHVYQYQNNPNYDWSLAAREGLDRGTYTYARDPSKDFYDYKFEHPVQILQDYFLAQNGRTRTGATLSATDRATAIQEYETIVGPYGLGLNPSVRTTGLNSSSRLGTNYSTGGSDSAFLDMK